MSSLHHSRRGMLAALAATPLVATCTAGMPAVAGSSDLSRLIAVAEVARRRSEAFYDDVSEPAEAAYEEAVNQIPYVENCGTFDSVAGTPFTLSTAQPGLVAIARRVAADPPRSSLDADYVRACRSLIATAGGREAERLRLRAVYRVAEFDAEWGRLHDITHDAELAAIKHPAASVADISMKLDMIEATGRAGDGEGWQAIADDVRRLAGRCSAGSPSRRS